MSGLPSRMRAAFVRRPGPADTIEVGTVPLPRLGARDVLVRNTILAVNHVDTFVRSGAYRTRMPMPFVVGRDLVGTVVATGAEVTSFHPGDQVWCNSLGHDGRQGSFAEYAAVPQERLYRLPPGVDPREAIGVLHTAATGYIGLFREARIGSGETIFVAGAAGGVGSAVVQMAAAAGARVIAATMEGDAEWCFSCGAQEVIDRQDPHLPEKIAAAAPGGVDVWWDNSGWHDFDMALPLLRQGGRVIVLAGLGARPTLPVGELYTRDASLRGFVLSNASVSDLLEAATMINRLLTEKRLRCRIGAELPLEETAEAHRLMEARKPKGRVVVTP